MASAISGFINTIRTAVYGEQVRGAIVSALEQCYSDVNAPSLQTAAFTAALNAAYAGGILDIQTVTQISAMTNQNIIYRYNGTEAGKQKGLYYYSALSSSWVLIGSEIHAVSLIAQMTDTNAIYKYTGTQSGMVQNSLYCHNGTSWVPIGSGVLTASTVAQMTNTGAIYKYTGNESGYYQNVLYYYDGTAWVPVGQPTATQLTAENAGKPADAYAVGLEIKRAGFSDNAKNAILECFKNVAWNTDNGVSLYADLQTALFPADPGELPETLQAVEYIQSNGTQVIDTDYDIQDGTIKVVATVQADAAISGAGVFFVAAWDEAAGAYVGQMAETGSNWGLGASASFILQNVSALNANEITMTFATNKCTLAGGGSSVSRDRTGSISDQTLKLFGLISNGSPVYGLSGKMYDVKIYNSGNTLVSRLVPCYRKSDGKIGMYDTIKQTFLTNIGTGNFTKGGDVNE